MSRARRVVGRPSKLPQIGRRNIPVQLLLYLIVGALSLCTDFVVFFTLLPINLSLAVVAGFVVGALTNYALCTLIAFSGGRYGRAQEILRLFLVALIGVGLTLGIVLALTTFGFTAFMAKIYATIIVFAWNYLGRRLFVFLPEIPERSWTLANDSIARLEGHHGEEKADG